MTLKSPNQLTDEVLTAHFLGKYFKTKHCSPAATLLCTFIGPYSSCAPMSLFIKNIDFGNKVICVSLIIIIQHSNVKNETCVLVRVAHYYRLAAYLMNL